MRGIRSPLRTIWICFLRRGWSRVCLKMPPNPSAVAAQARNSKYSIRRWCRLNQGWPSEARVDRAFWGRLDGVGRGAHLANAAAAGGCEVFYWRERNREVDFIVKAGRTLTAIEVKSGRECDFLPGIAAFTKEFKPTRTLLVGAGGIPLEEFLSQPVARWVSP